MVSEARDWRWCCLARDKACRRRGRAVEKPDDSQWSSAVESITLYETYTGSDVDEKKCCSD